MIICTTNTLPIEINLGYFLVSNIIRSSSESESESKPAKVVLLVNEQKYSILALMLKFCQCIIDQKYKIDDNKYSKAKHVFKLNINEINILEKFASVPNVIPNKYNCYLGNYLICNSRSSISKSNKYTIGSIIPITVRFKMSFHLVNNVKVFDSIIPQII